MAGAMWCKTERDRVKAVRTIILGGLAALFAAVWAEARGDELSDPMALTGLWQTDGKGSLVELYGCAEDGSPLGFSDLLCGRVAHAKKAELNGRLVLVNFAPLQAPKFKGRIIDPRTGSVYRGRLRLLDANRLEVRGCLLVFCRKQVWRRVAPSERLLVAGEGSDQPGRAPAP